MHGAEVTYSATSGNGNYGDKVALVATNLVDTTLANSSATAPKSGYAFTITKVDFATGTPSKFAIAAQPAQSSGVTATGTRSFGIDTPGVIRTGAATAITSASGDLAGTSTVLNN